MKISSDPAIHRHREQQLLQHVQRLLTDDRLRLDTSTGNRSITSLIRDVTRDDHATDLKRTDERDGRARPRAAVRRCRSARRSR